MKVEMEMTGTWYFTEGRVTTPYREGKRYTVEEHICDAAIAAGKACAVAPKLRKEVTQSEWDRVLESAEPRTVTVHLDDEGE